MTKSPVVALDRGVAVARVHGAEKGLDAMKNLPLESYYLLNAVRGSLSAELDRYEEATEHFKKAESLASLPSEPRFLRRRRDEGKNVFTGG